MSHDIDPLTERCRHCGLAEMWLLEFAELHNACSRPAGFITGDWSVEYSHIVYGTAEESRDSQRALLKAACAETNIFPAAAMRDSALSDLRAVPSQGGGP